VDKTFPVGYCKKKLDENPVSTQNNKKTKKQKFSKRKMNHSVRKKGAIKKPVKQERETQIVRGIPVT